MKKYNYEKFLVADFEKRRDARRYTDAVRNNANRRVIPYLIATGIKVEGKLKAIVKASISKDDLFSLTLAIEKYQKNLKEIQDPYLAEEVRKFKRENFDKTLKNVCGRGISPDFQKVSWHWEELDKFFDIDIKKDRQGKETSATLGVNWESLEKSLIPELTEKEREVFDKKCQVCDLLNEIFEFNTSHPSQYSLYNKAWSDAFVCEYQPDGKPYFRPSERLDGKDMKIVF